MGKQPNFDGASIEPYNGRDVTTQCVTCGAHLTDDEQDTSWGVGKCTECLRERVANAQ